MTSSEAHAHLPDDVVRVLGRDADGPLALADAGEDPRPAALVILNDRFRSYDIGDRPSSPPASLLRAIWALEAK